MATKRKFWQRITAVFLSAMLFAGTLGDGAAYVKAEELTGGSGAESTGGGKIRQEKRQESINIKSAQMLNVQTIPIVKLHGQHGRRQIRFRQRQEIII